MRMRTRHGAAALAAAAAALLAPQFAAATTHKSFGPVHLDVTGPQLRVDEITVWADPDVVPPDTGAGVTVACPGQAVRILNPLRRLVRGRGLPPDRIARTWRDRRSFPDGAVLCAWVAGKPGMPTLCATVHT